MGKGSIINLDDYVLQPCRKEAKRQTILKSLIPMGEERFLTVNNGSLYVFKRAPKTNIAVKNLGRFFSKQIPEDQQQTEEQQIPKGLVKSCTELERLFKIQVLQGKANQSDFELILHFVNKARNPLELPEVKKYKLQNDQ